MFQSKNFLEKYVSEARRLRFKEASWRYAYANMDISELVGDNRVFVVSDKNEMARSPLHDIYYASVI